MNVALYYHLTQVQRAPSTACTSFGEKWQQCLGEREHRFVLHARPRQSSLRDRVKAAGLEMVTTSNALSREDTLFSGFRRVTTPFRLVENLDAVGKPVR
jgi:hypothetical protein